MNKDQIIQETYNYAKKTLDGQGNGHDFWHVFRVWKMAKEIAKKEKADMFTVELASLLHDISDWKFNGGDDKLGAKIAKDFLKKLNVDKKVVENVRYIIENMSFKGGT